MPSCIAHWPVNGSMRRPKPEALYGALTGIMVGSQLLLHRLLEELRLEHAQHVVARLHLARRAARACR